MATPFPINPQLTALAMTYRNPAHALIADLVLPRVGTAQKFTYTSYDSAQGYTVPDTRVARKGSVNRVDFGGVGVTSETEDHGLDDVVPMADIAAWEAMPKPATGGPINPENISTMFLTGLIDLDREVRAANIVFSLNTYVAAQRATLSGTSQWSDFVNSNPLDAILAAMDTPLVRPNLPVFGQAVWTKLRQHPKIVQAVFGTAQGAGSITREQMANLLEVPRIVVGSGFLNTARRGQPANMQRVWGKSAAFIYTDEMAAQTNMPTFGWTAQFGTRISSSSFDEKVGLRGANRILVGESVKEVISAPDLGYFFQNAVA